MDNFGISDAQKISFRPSESVTFHSLTEKQHATLQITNGWDKPILFKMKSTRPTIFKMRPVYGLVATGETRKIRLLFKGFESTYTPPANRDRFTVVVAPAPEKCADPAKVWREAKTPHVTTMAVRKVLQVIYDPKEPEKAAAPAKPEQINIPPAPAPTPVTTPAPAAPSSSASSASDVVQPSQIALTQMQEPSEQAAPSAPRQPPSVSASAPAVILSTPFPAPVASLTPLAPAPGAPTDVTVQTSVVQTVQPATTQQSTLMPVPSNVTTSTTSATTPTSMQKTSLTSASVPKASNTAPTPTKKISSSAASSSNNDEEDSSSSSSCSSEETK